MKTYAYFGIFLFVFSAFPVSQAVAEKEEPVEMLSLDEAKALLDSFPTAKDAVSGTVPTEVPQEYYDMYIRQLKYREHVKDLRASLDERRESFANPRTETIERFREVIAKVYACLLYTSDAADE